MEQSHQDLLKKFNTDEQIGLSSQEAKRRFAEKGPNAFQETKRTSLLQSLWNQVNSILIYILIAAAIISTFVGEYSDAVIIGLVIFLNAMIGVIQESKAEKSLEELKKISTPKAVVIRDGVTQEIPSEELVVGDIVILDAGRMIPADLRLLESANLKVEESSLTGESIAVEKDARWEEEGDVPLGDKKNMAFMSTLVTYGRGKGVVIRTGMDTEIGKIAQMLDKKTKEMTPLEKKLDELGKILGIAAIIICALIFFIGFFQGRDVLEMFLIAVSLAVAVIPEGLPAIVTIVLALGVRRMIQQNAIIRQLPAVETLGSVNVICSDKTGTLTQNKMTVTQLYINGRYGPVENFSRNNSTTNRFIHAIILCNDASIIGSSRTGDPTEIALIELGGILGLTKQEAENKYPRIAEIAFDSERKMMTTVHETHDEKLVFVKGALESVLPKTIYAEIDGEVVPFTEEMKNNIHKQVEQMSERALRVLTIAYKKVPLHTRHDENLEEELVFLGLTGMIDPPREEVKDSIEKCHKAGIRVIMITGDHRKTALAIAKELKIAEHESETMTGQELNQMSDQELQQRVESIRVFARVSPEHKVRIVQALKNNDKIVSMTGDGVNDAPSLKEANVGVAMGITGTDVAKGAADVVLTDDNFSTITAAVEEGRNIYQNIKKSILFLISCNLGELLALFFGILMGWPAPLTAVHILWVNLVTDTLPAISLGTDPEDPDIMEEKPRDAKEKIFSKSNLLYSIWNGLAIGGITLFAFVEGLKQYTNIESFLAINYSNISSDALIHAQTMAFITLSISQLFHSLNLRSVQKSIFKVGIFTNHLLVWSIMIGVVIQLALVYIPFFNQVFGIRPLLWNDWFLIIGLSMIPLILNEIIKFGNNLFNKSHEQKGIAS